MCVASDCPQRPNTPERSNMFTICAKGSRQAVPFGSQLSQQPIAKVPESVRRCNTAAYFGADLGAPQAGQNLAVESPCGAPQLLQKCPGSAVVAARCLLLMNSQTMPAITAIGNRNTERTVRIRTSSGSPRPTIAFSIRKWREKRTPKSEIGLTRAHTGVTRNESDSLTNAHVRPAPSRHSCPDASR
jgi:hypothetical protein